MTTYERAHSLGPRFERLGQTTGNLMLAVIGECSQVPHLSVSSVQNVDLLLQYVPGIFHPGRGQLMYFT